jgi:hypothetical protein
MRLYKKNSLFSFKISPNSFNYLLQIFCEFLFDSIGALQKNQVGRIDIENVKQRGDDLFFLFLVKTINLKPGKTGLACLEL